MPDKEYLRVMSSKGPIGPLIMCVHVNVCVGGVCVQSQVVLWLQTELETDLYPKY